jgi:hypothetical protein
MNDMGADGVHEPTMPPPSEPESELPRLPGEELSSTTPESFTSWKVL